MPVSLIAMLSILVSEVDAICPEDSGACSSAPAQGNLLLQSNVRRWKNATLEPELLQEELAEDAASQCADLDGNCPYYTAYCGEARIQQQCRRTCGQCGGSGCADLDGNCPYYTAYCGDARIQQQCRRTCGRCGSAPSPSPSSCVDLSDSCGGWVGQGYCSPSSQYYQYMQDNCCASCGFGGGPSPSPSPGPPSSGGCVGLSTNANSATAKNIIIMPSGFTSSSDWASFASSVNSFLKRYTPLNPDSISSLNTWYVSDFMPGDRGNKCWFDATTTRLLLCQVEEFRAHADRTCGFGRDASLVVVHNTETYGGAGYMTEDVATMTRNGNSAGLAAHELGHSFLGLSDEYQYAGSGGGSNSPNCDDSSCNKWSDLRNLVQQGYFAGRQVGCVPGCLNNARWTPMSSTIMRDIQSTDFGLVNERATCCKYLNYAVSHGLPSYCDQFNAYGLNLNSHCRQLRSFGARYMGIEKPVLWRLTRVEANEWRCDRQKALNKGVYQAWRQHGDDPEEAGMSRNGTSAGIRVIVEDPNSGERMVKWFADHYMVEVPLQDEHLVHVGSHDRVAQKRHTVDIVLSEGQICRPA